MTEETKKLVLEGLQRLRGDDYERASAAFRNCTPTQMAEQYGQSGRTRQEILDGYRNHVKRIEVATAEIRNG